MTQGKPPSKPPSRGSGSLFETRIEFGPPSPRPTPAAPGSQTANESGWPGSQPQRPAQPRPAQQPPYDPRRDPPGRSMGGPRTSFEVAPTHHAWPDQIHQPSWVDRAAAATSPPAPGHSERDRPPGHVARGFGSPPPGSQKVFTERSRSGSAAVKPTPVGPQHARAPQARPMPTPVRPSQGKSAVAVQSTVYAPASATPRKPGQPHSTEPMADPRQAVTARPGASQRPRVRLKQLWIVGALAFAIFSVGLLGARFLLRPGQAGGRVGQLAERVRTLLSDDKTSGLDPNAPRAPNGELVRAIAVPDAEPPPRVRPAASAQDLTASIPALEKEAVELLIANDYRKALPLYEQLHAAAPQRPEFDVMVRLLTRRQCSAESPCE